MRTVCANLGNVTSPWIVTDTANETKKNVFKKY